MTAPGYGPFRNDDEPDDEPIVQDDRDDEPADQDWYDDPAADYAYDPYKDSPL